MPANLPPQYYQIESKYREAKSIPEKISLLKEMLAIMPKHKGTDKLQAELRAKISKLQKTLEKKPAVKRQSSPYFIPKEGAGQIIMVGYPNVGKSLLLTSLTRASSPSTNYPFSTLKPVVGMMPFEDIQFQLIDTPSLSPDFMDKGLPIMVRNSDLVLLVVDGGNDEVLEEVEGVREKLREKNIVLGGKEGKKTLIVVNKMDKEGAKERASIVEELYGEEYSVIRISALRKEWNNLGRRIFDALELIRVYTKAPGAPPSRQEPIILKKGSRVIDAAVAIHKDFANMKYARLWDDYNFQGLRVEREYPLKDGDILEFHL